MSCDQIQYYINFATQEIQYWTTLLNSLTYKLFSGDKTTAENISQILQVQNTKLQLYQQAQQFRCINVQPVVTTTTTEPLQEVVTNGSGGSGLLLPLLLIAGGVWFISRKKRNQRRYKRYVRTNRKR